MKTCVLIFITILFNSTLIAQKIKVQETSENIGGGTHKALSVTLYNISPSDAEDAFKSFMKKYDGKRNSKDGAVFIDHALVKELSNNTIDIYGKALGKKDDKEIIFVIAFDLGGSFLNSSEHKAQYDIAERIVKEFAVKATKDAIEGELKAAQKAQSKMEDQQKELEKDKSDLESDIENYKGKIKKAEEDIVKNKADQEKKKAEIEAQKKVVEEVDKKLKAVE